MTFTQKPYAQTHTAMKALALTLLTTALIAHLDAYAQTTDTPATDEQIITPGHPVWLLEQPDAVSPALTARTFGTSQYGDYRVKALLQISCHPHAPKASLTLEIMPPLLGFDSDPFEGKDASANGPLRVTTGTRPAVDHWVNGVWNAGGAFQVNTLFALSTAVSREELAYWVSDASRGQTVEFSLTPATDDGRSLTASFSLPENNRGLEKIVQPCLSDTSTSPVEP